jgi:CDP-diacylglycerol--glycerol-3-phosphate 3-phosphatidyltransferase/cardiolipin synthase
LAGASFQLGDIVRLPNLLSLARLPLALAFPLAIDRPPLAIGVLAGAALSDVLDGWLARRLELVTDIGAIIDPLADKAFAITVVVTLVSRGALSWLGVVALLTREILETPLVFWFVAQRRHGGARSRGPHANALGKAATVLQFGAVASAVALPSALSTLITLTAAVGVAAGVGYWIREVSSARRQS